MLVLAKAPVPGRVKTRLCPPLSAAEAAAVAEAALADTLEQVAACGADRKLLALDGEPGGWLPPGFTVFAQQGLTFADRLAHAWRTAGGPGVQIGMDTPQVTVDLLDDCLAVMENGPSARLGPALDGGWWALGLRWGWERDPFVGVPMSVSSTYAHQRRRLEQEGHQVSEFVSLRDVDSYPDAVIVAADHPAGRLAHCLSSLGRAR